MLRTFRASLRPFRTAASGHANSFRYTAAGSTMHLRTFAYSASDSSDDSDDDDNDDEIVRGRPKGAKNKKFHDPLEFWLGLPGDEALRDPSTTPVDLHEGLTQPLSWQCDEEQDLWLRQELLRSFGGFDVDAKTLFTDSKEHTKKRRRGRPSTKELQATSTNTAANQTEQDLQILESKLYSQPGNSSDELLSAVRESIRAVSGAEKDEEKDEIVPRAFVRKDGTLKIVWRTKTLQEKRMEEERKAEEDMLRKKRKTRKRKSSLEVQFALNVDEQLYNEYRNRYPLSLFFYLYKAKNIGAAPRGRQRQLTKPEKALENYYAKQLGSIEASKSRFTPPLPEEENARRKYWNAVLRMISHSFSPGTAKSLSRSRSLSPSLSLSPSTGVTAAAATGSGVKSTKKRIANTARTHVVAVEDAHEMTRIATAIGLQSSANGHSRSINLRSNLPWMVTGTAKVEAVEIAPRSRGRPRKDRLSTTNSSSSTGSANVDTKKSAKRSSGGFRRASPSSSSSRSVRTAFGGGIGGQAAQDILSYLQERNREREYLSLSLRSLCRALRRV